jgi:hypothetical protein
LGSKKPVKTIIASFLSLALGLIIGWCFEHHRAVNERNALVQQMVQGGESSDGERAARAARAIQMIDSGQKEEAVELLSRPVAHYYSVYGRDDRNDQRSKVRALIEQVAATNQIVGARIAGASKTAQTKTQ